MNVRIAASATAEFVEAVRWYEDTRRGLGAAFFDAVSAVLSRIEEHPNIGAPFADGHRIRRVLIVEFPYQVVYAVRPTELVVVAIAHLRRRPKYWVGPD